MTEPVSDEREQVVSDAVRRMVEKRAAVIDDKVERLRFVRQSIAAHEAATRRRVNFLRRSLTVHQASRRRFYLSLRIVSMALLLAVGLVPQASRGVSRRPLPPPATPRPIAAETAAPKVWLVERQAAVEIYSNGLRVENAFFTSSRARAYRAYDRQGWRASEIETQPAGIVFHTTESRMAPFEPSQNSRLQRNGRNLLAFIAAHHFYLL